MDDYFALPAIIFGPRDGASMRRGLLKRNRVETQPNIKGIFMSSTPTPAGDDSSAIHLIVADVWNEGSEEPIEVHMMFRLGDDEDLVQTALGILADEGYHEAELLEIGTISEEPEEEPHKSAWKTANDGQVALIEFDGDDEE